MATRSENLFLPPPRPQEQWKEFMNKMEKGSGKCRDVISPQSFLKLITSGGRLPNKLEHLRSLLTEQNHPTVSQDLLLGVITRKFHPVCFKKKLSTDSCCTVWMQDATDEVRVTFWGDPILWANYEKLQEGRLLVIEGYKIKPSYSNGKYGTYEVARLSPAEAFVLETSLVEVIDLYSIWDARPNDKFVKQFLKRFSNFGFCPTSLSSLSLSPSPSSNEYSRSLVARVLYKSSVRNVQSKLGEVPSMWLALYDGSLSGEEEGSLGREYVWMLLRFNFQTNLFDRLESNQLIVATNLKAARLYHDQWRLPGYDLVLHSTSCTQVYIIDEELPSSAWHYTRSVYRQKSDLLASQAATLSWRFRDSAPEITQENSNSILLRQGNFECLIQC